MSSSDAADAPRGEADLLDDATRAIAALDSHPDEAVREAAQTLLAGVDAVHRTGLTHLVAAIQGMAGEAFLNRLVADPAIRLLLMSYNLIAVDRRLQAEEALDPVRGHLHDHGVDVELADVIGGVVSVRLHRSSRAADSPLPPVDAVRRDLEAALREGLLGFQELEILDRERTAAPAATIPLSRLQRARQPVYADAGTADLDAGALRAVEIQRTPVLLAAVGADLHAVHNRCGDSPLPLEFSTVDGAVLRCSWHGCRYDLRTGHRLDGGGDRLAVYPVKVSGGRVLVAVGTEASRQGS